ncbi:MAG TPA: hypothetical protein VD997_03775 [Phycisphaerales bacterium]|nr:hypothetical protein [Phycisphaerales bacterium]
MVAPSPLPDLPQRHLLTALLELNADLPAVAARTRTPLDELTRWAHSEAVHAWLEAHNHFAQIAREHRELSRVTRNLDDLEKLAATTDNPIEKRRILTAILRGATAILSGRAFRPRTPSREVTTAESQSRRGEERLARDPQPASTPPRELAPLPLTLQPAPAKTSAPATPRQADLADRADIPALPSTPPISIPLSPPFYSQDLPLARTKRKHSASHLLATAGLPAP